MRRDWRLVLEREIGLAPRTDAQLRPLERLRLCDTEPEPQLSLQLFARDAAALLSP